MSDSEIRFDDRNGAGSETPELWPAIVIPKERLDEETERLASLPRPANGRRQTLIAHPRASEPGLGLAPGIRVMLEVLLPGEESAPIRHNSTQVNFCIRGGGTSLVQGREIHFGQYDVWNFPCWATYLHKNPTRDLQVRLTYSNAALLEKMNVHVVEENPPALQAVPDADAEGAGEAPRPPFETFQMNEEGAWLMPYETLINPKTVESRALHWPWKEVKGHLDKLQALGKEYKGRRVLLMYNPRTGDTNGTTPNFFATMCVRPANIVDQPHRHISAAINYYFSGSGRSTVEGKVFPWKAGDLMLSAPGWGVHNHASDGELVYELTIQDQPLNLAMESLLWQENLNKPLAVLGAQEGFATNRAVVGGSE